MKSRASILHMAVLAVLLLPACAPTQLASHYAKKWSGSSPPPASAGTYKVGKPYRVGGTWYYPEENFRLVETGIASWYGPDFHGKKTANGEIYDQNEMTAAHRTLQMPSFVRVTNLENGRSVVVRVNDRGPYLRGRVIDVSKRAAHLLGFINQGTARVRVEVLEQESRKVAEAARRGMDTSRMTVADMGRIQPAAITRGMQVAELRGDLETVPDALPESLQTPTITVEELNRPGTPSVATQAPKWTAAAPKPNPAARPHPPVPMHVRDGRALPDPVVSTAPVAPTGIFVQAGAFGVRENADRLAQRLSAIAPVRIDPVSLNGRTLYRVKLGPLSSVAEADAVLDKVARAGGDGAKVVKSR